MLLADAEPSILDCFAQLMTALSIAAHRHKPEPPSRNVSSRQMMKSENRFGGLDKSEFCS
jgi:hypothetical protein